MAGQAARWKKRERKKKVFFFFLETDKTFNLKKKHTNRVANILSIFFISTLNESALCSYDERAAAAAAAA